MSRSRLRIPEPYRVLAKLARASGWELTRTGSGHLKWRRPDGGMVVTASTPSDHRGVRNDKARLKRAGLTEETP